MDFQGRENNRSPQRPITWQCLDYLKLSARH